MTTPSNAGRFSPQAVIRRKRDGEELHADEIRRFVAGVTDGTVAPAQLGAFTMATYLNGMTPEETMSLVLAMRDSGSTIDWRDHGVDPRLVVEKHSSGGVGDEKVTLLVVPILAALGLVVPNMSAWGLDYCPGECDMLDAVPGYVAQPRLAEFAGIVARTGGGISGPTPDLAPADTEIFRVRDVSATVESVPLIAGSILSKKLSVSPSGVVISVGCGDGAFMHTLDEARSLAIAMRDVLTRVGIPSVLLITDLESVLGTSVGSAVEMLEVVDFLTGAARDRRVRELVEALCVEALVLTGRVADAARGAELVAEALSSGAAAAKFDEILHAQGGPAGFTERAADILPAAAVVRPVHAGSDGWLAGMNTTEVGLTLVQLGGGRVEPGAAIDVTVGFTGFAQIGDPLDESHPICVLHARSEEEWEAAAARLRAAMSVSDTSVPQAGSIVRERWEGSPA
ncbi:thymidine phosphorylase [Microbacterium sp. SORGH_AS_0888]|uniref:thymidine phosphorylase n=1 Tax=Microbacterium sp. SORGH_AS_0888 TaxID=3041791 RepID=UPI0027872892|nr:thymidine phosphorylase [Microbacterium sp. SORGH_AS_0888]MDQ1130325.1 thymidine phosphorylase [Microbacterium sp. SORGH_AS_0888]